MQLSGLEIFVRPFEVVGASTFASAKIFLQTRGFLERERSQLVTLRCDWRTTRG